MEERTLLSSVVWTGNAHDNNWDTPGNWNTDSLPGFGDDVTINTSADVAHSDSMTDTINSLTSSQPLTISGGTLSIASAFTTSSTLTISGGTPNDPGAITVGGLLTLNSGGVSGSGTVTAKGGILINSPNSSLVLDGCTLINPAGQTATWSGVGSDGVQMDDGAVFNNLGTFLAQTHGRIGDGQGAGSAFNNEGSFTKSTDSGSLEFGEGVTFNNNGGTVDVQTGTLSLDVGGTDTAGSYTSESGATLELGGSRTLDAASTIGGAGTVDFGYFGNAGTISMLGTYSVTGTTIDDGGTVNIGGTVNSIGTAFTSSSGALNFTTAFPGSAGTIATVNISKGTANFGPNALTVTTLTNSANLINTGDITISGLTTLSGGSISGSGDVTANGGILMNGTSLLDGRSLINPAGQTATFTGGGALGIGLQMGDGAIFNNFGTFLVQTHGFIEQGFGAAAVFNNQGSFVKSTDSGVLEVTPSIVFNVNGGTVEVQTGTLDLQGGGVNTSAAYAIESGATLDLGGDSYFTFDNASSISGTGNLIKDGLGTSSITLDGSSPLFTGPTTVNAGMFLVDGSQSNNPITATDSTVGGSGTVGPITTVGSTISPGASRLLNGPGILTVQGDVTMNSTSTYTVELNGPNPGTGGYSQLDAIGRVDLAGSTLSASLGFTPSTGESFTIIHSTSPIMHTFNGLAEGATLTIGSVPFRITYIGGSGDDVVLTQAGTLQGTMTTTVSSQSPSSVGQQVTFTATVAPTAGSGIPTGNVTFTIDGQAQTPVPLEAVGGVDQASLPPISSLTGGSHTIVASYSGDATFATSSGTTVQAVTRAGSTTTLAASPNTSTAGQTVTLTATVTPDARSTDTPTGTVTFEEGTTVLGTAPLGADGTATFSIATLAVGSDTITAAYSGDANFATASGVTTETVNAPTTPPPATSTGPRLTSVQRFGFHAMPTTVVLTFDQPLDPGPAEDVRNYVILNPSGHRIRMNRAVLDPTRLTVTLHPAQRISIHHPYQLIVNGAGPGAVSNMSGQPLDSVEAGQPGSSDHVVLTWRQLVLGDVSKAFRIRYGLVPKGPRAMIPAGVSSPKAALGNRGAKTGPHAKLLAIDSMAANGPLER